MRRFLAKVMNNQSLTEEEMVEAARELFHEKTTDAQIAAFLVALKTKGETVDEIVGLVRVIREHALTIPSGLTDVMDNCGTGGDGSKSFNISTTASFVLAGGGVTVAKHGNRSISSKTGSADVLEQLGVRLDFTPEETVELLKENGISFLFAPHIHAGIKRVMLVRRELGVPTIFNLIGPLTNPVGLSSQLVGIYKEDGMQAIAEAMERLGRKRGVVLHGAGGMDEASLAGENKLVILRDQHVLSETLHPSDLGLPVVPNDKIVGGDAAENARILLDVLSGKTGVHRDTVVLNAAIGFYANGKAASIQEGVQLAGESIDSGRAMEKLDYLRSYSQKGAIAK